MGSDLPRLAPHVSYGRSASVGGRMLQQRFGLHAFVHLFGVEAAPSAFRAVCRPGGIDR